MKYIVFGWSKEADKNGPADQLLGTTNKLVEAYEPYYRCSEAAREGTAFGLKMVERELPLAKHLFMGKPQQAKVFISYTETKGWEEGVPIFAYYEIPGTE